jgi:hypothetical protein
LSAEHIAYCAGLFDGEGCVQYKIYPRKYKSGNMGKVWGITMEINMTEIEPLHYFLNVVKHGSVTKIINHYELSMPTDILKEKAKFSNF